jgi:hypothetical protein
MTEPRLVLLLAWKIAEILNKSRPGDDCTPFAQDVILEVAAWLRKRNVRVRASVEIAGDLEREINQAQPEPEGPTDEELLEAVKAGVASFPPRHPEALNLSAVEYEVELEIRKARAVLARWGNRSAPQPIPVSERLPGVRDCAPWPGESDASAWGWVGSDVCWLLGGRPRRLHPLATRPRSAGD